MTYIIIIGILVLLVLIAIVVEIRQRRQKEAIEAGGVEVISGEVAEPSFTSRITEGLKGIGDWFGNNKQEALSANFRQWAAESLEQEEGLKAWLASLSDEGVQALSGQLASFSADLNMDLEWLLNGQLEEEPELKQALEEIVVAFCLACWKATQVQDEVEVYTTYQNLEDNPNSRKNRDLTQQLFVTMVNKELVPAASTELFVATDKERHTYMLAAVRDVANKDRATFDSVLKEVIWADRIVEDGAGEADEFQEQAAPAPT